MNSAFRDILSYHAASAIAAAKALSDVHHDGLRGQLREILVGKFLAPLLPPSLGIGTGEIIAHTGEHSSQQDVVIYDKSIMPPALVADANSGLFPIDAVLYTVEVKSTLDPGKLKETHEKAIRMEKMNYLQTNKNPDNSRNSFPGPTGPIGAVDNTNPNPEKVICCLFAFDTDLKKKSEIKRLQEILKGTPALRAICVVNRGYWFWSERQGWEQGHVAKQNFPGDEMLDFASTILESHERIKSTRSKSLNAYLCANTAAED